MRRKSHFLRPFPYLIMGRERAPGASGWAGQSGVSELPVHAKLLGVNIPVTVRPSLPLEKPVGIIPQMRAQLAPG